MPTRTTPNPLDAYVTTKPSDWARDFKLPPLPKIRDAMAGKSLLDGLSAHDVAQEKWRATAEQSLSERIRQLETSVVTTPAAVTETVTTPPPSSPPSTPATPGVISVNDKTGVVTLNSDDIPEGLVNFYLTISRWLAMFDAYGFHVNDIPVGNDVLIPAGRNLVMTGPLSVEGTLTVDGYLTQV